MRFNSIFKIGSWSFCLTQNFNPYKQNHFHNLDLEYEISGNINGPVILLQGGISSSKHAASSKVNQVKGWWENIVGVGKCIDLEKYCVLSIDYLDFNGVTTHEQANAISILLHHLEIESLNTFVGYSYGGMVALAFAELYSNKVEHVIALGASYESVPQSYALRLIQQKIVELSKGTNNEKEALATARQLGIITYRSSEEINTRFNCNENSVVSYLKKKGDDFSSVFTAERFLSLSRSINSHKVIPHKINVKRVSLICCRLDQVVPLIHVKQFAKEIASPVVLYEIDSIYGHDSYLNETQKISEILKEII